MAQSQGRRAQHRNLTPNPLRTPEQFRSNLRNMMRRFVMGQNELLLTARYLDDQESTLNSEWARIEESINRTFPDLDDAKVQAAVALLKPLLSEIRTPKPDSEAEQEARNRQFSERVAKAAGELDKHLPPGHAFGCIDAALQTMGTSDRLSRISASLLISLVAEFEVLVANLFGELFRCFPDSTVSKDKTFNWEYITETDTMAGLKERIIEEAVSAAMYQSYGSWLSKFETFAVTLPEIAKAPETTEIFQRRHVIVHNGGRVSALYVDRCKVEPVPRLDSVLDVSLNYLTNAADHLFAVAARIYSEVVCKIFDTEAERRHLEGILSKNVYELLSHRRFEALVKAVEAIDVERLADPETQEILTVNKWLALKRMNRFEECRSDVEAWDTGDQNIRLRLAKLALLDEIDEGLQLIGEIRGTKDLSIDAWAVWPLLEELRRAENERMLERGGVQDSIAGVDEMLSGELT